MWAKISDWLDERFQWRQVWEAIFLRKIPHVNWFYTLGSATLFVAILQGVTGILLTMYYVPDPTRAYDSVTYITTQLPMGWFIRGLHHWGASAMVVLVVAHMLRVFFYGAYKYPREMTWVTGVLLFLIVIGFGFTGYLLPWDQKAYWATKVGTSVIGTVPVVGDYAMRIMRGGSDLGALTLTRFYTLHVLFLPLGTLIFLIAHFVMIRKQGISTPL